MTKLEKFNRTFKVVQNLRLYGGAALLVLGVCLVSEYRYGKGVADCGAAVTKYFPEQSKIITDGIEKMTENL